MICKFCKRQIDDDSIFCKWCGERQVKERKKKAEISVPAPRVLPSGTYFGRLMLNGERVSVSAPSEKEYYAKARAIKAGLIEAEKKASPKTLQEVCKEYIEKRTAVLSPSTIRGYDAIIRLRFGDFMNKQAAGIDYQQMINTEAGKCSAKTVVNAWGFVKAALKDNALTIPPVTLPQVVAHELPWLEPEQIPTFLAAIAGKPCEYGALFALHGLRRSELYAVTPADISKGVIHVAGAAVTDKNGRLVHKETTKNISSRRDVPIRIPRLQELIDKDTRPEDEPYVQGSLNRLYSQINSACRAAGLPLVGVHGLRRTFASLAYSLGWSELATMQAGGWSDKDTMDKKYIKLARADAQRQGDSMSEFYQAMKNGNKFGNGNKKP